MCCSHRGRAQARTIGAAAAGNGSGGEADRPQFVSPYRLTGKTVKTGKNDAADAAAICEAASRPSKR